MKKIIHVITRMDMGGSAQNTLLTCLGLDQEKYCVVLVFGLSLESKMIDIEKTLVSNRLEKAKKQGIKIVIIQSLVRRIHPLYDLRSLLFLWRLFKKEKPEIVHTHSSKAGILGRLAAILTGVPHVIHTPHGHVFYGHFGIVASKIFLYMESFFARLTDKIVALTEGEKKDYINFSVCGADKVTIIHSGINIEKYFAGTVDLNKKKKSLGLKADDVVVGMVGWLLPIKGPVQLLNAMELVWKEFPNVKLIYVGKGDLENLLKRKAADLNAEEKVIFTGWREDIHEIMNIFNVFVLPSLNEGMGRVLVEAMAAGKAIVASRTGGIPDLISHGKNGLLVPPGDEAGLASSIIRLLKHPDEATKFGQRGKDICHQYSIQAMNQKIEDLYESL